MPGSRFAHVWLLVPTLQMAPFLERVRDSRTYLADSYHCSDTRAANEQSARWVAPRPVGHIYSTS